MTQHEWPGGINAPYVEFLYAKYLQDPGSVDHTWCEVFSGLNQHVASRPRGPGAGDAGAGTQDSVRALALIGAYRERGHLIARVDPLELSNREYHPDLDAATYGFTAQPDESIPLFGELGLEAASLNEIKAHLEQIYCGTLSAEFMHLDNPEQRAWIQRAMETDLGQPDAVQRTWILDQLVQAECFEQFMQVRFPSSKRYGMEGSESQLPLVETILQRAAAEGVEEIVIGPMHRGHTTFMATFMQKPLPAVFAEFSGESAHPLDLEISSDICFHLGHSTDREVNGSTLRISLPSHPSHVEAIIPVALGKSRAKQNQRKDSARCRVLGLMMHTDAGFSGQGVVAETFQLGLLPGYDTGGSVHVIVNNQIGFTTTPAQGRSSRYCSDPGKVVQAPILHVNADDPEAVVRAADMAVQFRQRFHRDIILDLVCYRRRGHNEVDEPKFTQPLMYERIDQLPTVRERYAQRLIEQGVLSEADVKAMINTCQPWLEQGFAASKHYRPNKPDWLEGRWSTMQRPHVTDLEQQITTGVTLDALQEIGTAICRVPTEFRLHPRIREQLKKRSEALQAQGDINWATAEALAFGSVLRDGHAVRLTGQDSRRGTFSQRHAVLYDQHSGEPYTPLAHIALSQGHFEIWDSPLSEAAVLGFEYGYSLAEPNALVLWEAQFGDFANGAQTFIDQFIASGEDKWLRMSGLVMLVPHGLEGGGPEHSSARVERYLQLCAKQNLQIVNCTTPANYFHVLRRQLQRDFRKPLVVMTPKSLLRHRLAVSGLKELGPDTSFQPVLGEVDSLVADADIRRVILSSGRIFYGLLEERRRAQISDVALIRIEELYPFPRSLIEQELSRYPGAEVVWCQEEPRNMGAWTFADRRLEEILRSIDLRKPSARYVGREECPSPGSNIKSVHAAEQTELIATALRAS